MIETFRAIGYSIETAVADIIDNSVSASAKNIWITFNWKGSETSLAIKDDGNGMSDEQVVRAMRPGSRNPRDTRSAKDLGRFGLGLKTASFSQCRKLSVVSKPENGQPAFWTWDLDFVNQTGEWDLVNYLPEDEKFRTELLALKSGTIVIWTDIDRLVRDFQSTDVKALDKFLKIIMEQVKKHLAMVFHRFVTNKTLRFIFRTGSLRLGPSFLLTCQGPGYSRRSTSRR